MYLVQVELLCAGQDLLENAPIIIVQIVISADAMNQWGVVICYRSIIIN